MSNETAQRSRDLLNTLRDVASGHYSPEEGCELIMSDFGHAAPVPAPDTRQARIQEIERALKIGTGSFTGVLTNELERLRLEIEVQKVDVPTGTGEEKCSICNHILNRQKNGCTCVGCYCPACNDAGTGEGSEHLPNAPICPACPLGVGHNSDNRHLSVSRVWLDKFGDTARGNVSWSFACSFAEDFAEQENAALRSQLEQAQLDFNTLYERAHMIERDLATAQARIARATTFLRRADATSTQNELYDLLDDTRRALAESQSGEK